MTPLGRHANLRVLETVRKCCDMAPELHHDNVDGHGNTSGARSGWVK